MYLVFKSFATIYERLRKASQLIRQKVDLDLEKQEIRDVVGISDELALEKFKQ